MFVLPMDKQLSNGTPFYPQQRCGFTELSSRSAVFAGVDMLLVYIHRTLARTSGPQGSSSKTTTTCPEATCAAPRKNVAFARHRLARSSRSRVAHFPYTRSCHRPSSVKLPCSSEAPEVRTARHTLRTVQHPYLLHFFVIGLAWIHFESSVSVELLSSPQLASASLDLPSS